AHGQGQAAAQAPAHVQAARRAHLDHRRRRQGHDGKDAEDQPLRNFWTAARLVASSTVSPAPPSGSVTLPACFKTVGLPVPLLSSEPMRPSSVGLDMSERTAFGAVYDTHGSRMKVSNELTLFLIAPRIFCWRRARVRSFSLGLQSLWRVLAKASACLPLIS